jgi:HAD superfamily hydrolase (TIGR01509 family)
MLRAIFWDNDGVLVDTESLYFRANHQCLRKLGVELTLEMYVELCLKSARGVWHLAEDAGLCALDVEALRRERDEVYGALLCEGDFSIAGAAGVLAGLHGRYRMGIVTSSQRRHFELIHRSTGLCRYFDFILAREDYGRSKPDPEPYLRALELTGLRPEECLVIEDSERGLMSATGAGLRCWVIPHELTRSGDFSAADQILEDISQVPGLLRARGW